MPDDEVIQMVDLAAGQDFSAANVKFNDVMGAKVDAALDAAKVNIASGLFNGGETDTMPTDAQSVSNDDLEEILDDEEVEELEAAENDDEEEEETY